MDAYEKHGHALFSGKVGYYPVSKKSALIVKTEEDLALADYVMRAEKENKKQKIKYDKLTSVFKEI